MSGVNRVILIGNLGKDPELRYTAGNQPVTKFSLATSVRWKDKDGNPQTTTEWHKIVVWGKMAEIASKYLRKGKQVFIEGRMHLNEWTDKENIKRYTTEVVCENLQFLGGPREGAAEGTPPPPGPVRALPAPSAAPPSAIDADVPF